MTRAAVAASAIASIPEGLAAEEAAPLPVRGLMLSTVTSAAAMAAVFSAFRPRGKLLVVGASMDPIGVPAAARIGGSKTVSGHASGTARDSEFAERSAGDERRDCRQWELCAGIVSALAGVP